MMAVPARPRGAIGMTVISIVMLAVLLSLGFWQLQRRGEKHALIAALTERLGAAPVALPPPAEWPALTAQHDEFRRVRFTASYPAAPDAMVYSSGSAIRKDVAGPGTWAFLPARLPGGETVVINAGFVPNTMQDRAQQNRAVASLATGAPAMLTGYIRFAETAGALTPAADANKRLWFTRDHRAMAQALGWAAGGRPPAPFYIDLESPAPANGVPKPGPLVVALKDNHLGYAVTWFGLAAAVAAAYAVWLFGLWRAKPVL